MRLGWRQLDVLRAADDGGTTAHVDPASGRVTVGGRDEWHPAAVLDGLLDRHLVELGALKPGGQVVELTDSGAAELNEYRRRHREAP